VVLEKILLINSDQGWVEMVAQALSRAGFKVVTAADTAAGLKAVYDTHPAMVIMDEELPPLDSASVCAQIYRMCHIPIIVLVDARKSIVRFLDMGADACLTRPLSLRLLLATVRSLFRRYLTRPGYDFPRGIELNTEKRQVNLGDNTIDLTPTEFRLLSCLLLNGDRLVPYPELAVGVWGKEGISPGGFKFYISCLRKKLANGGDSDFNLLNQRGVGFRFMVNAEC
jgi:DNA-binding response OmpR family regulator